MITRQLFEFRRRRRIFGKERIDQEIRTTGRNDLERGVPESGDRNGLFLVRRRRWRLRADWQRQWQNKKKSEPDAHAAVFH
jgi:hypothetical protein